MLVASVDKDRYNSTSPERDKALFAKYALHQRAGISREHRLRHQLRHHRTHRPARHLHTGRPAGGYLYGIRPPLRPGRLQSLESSWAATRPPTAHRAAGPMDGASATMSWISHSPRSPTAQPTRLRSHPSETTSRPTTSPSIRSSLLGHAA